MNKQQFDMDIQAADNNSLRIGAANFATVIMRKVRKDGYGSYARMPKMSVILQEK